MVWVDEAGVDNRLFRAYARAKRGQKIYADIPGKKRERYSMIGGLLGRAFIAPLTFKGGCHQELFNLWLEHMLLPKLNPGTTVVLDNARFHKSQKTRELIEAAGCDLLFLPTYSPDLNPIEHCWHTLKSRLRPLLQNNQSDFHDIIGQCLLTI